LDGSKLTEYELRAVALGVKVAILALPNYPWESQGLYFTLNQNLISFIGIRLEKPQYAFRSMLTGHIRQTSTNCSAFARPTYFYHPE
jgi:hypothetical protein